MLTMQRCCNIISCYHYHYLGKGIYLSQDHPLPLCFIRLAMQSNRKQRSPVKSDIASPKSSSFPCLFHLLQAPCFPWLIAPFSTFKTSNVAFSSLSVSDLDFRCHISYFLPAFVFILPSLPLVLLSLFYKDSSDNIEDTSII